MSGPQPPPGQWINDQPTYQPGGERNSGGGPNGGLPTERQRWTTALLAVGLVLLGAGAVMIVVLVSSRTGEVATSPTRSSDVRTSDSAPAPERDDPPTSSGSGDSDAPAGEVTLPDRQDKTAAGPGSDAGTRTTSATTPTTAPTNPAIPSTVELSNRHVAVVWSENRPSGDESDLEARVADYRLRFGERVFGLRIGSFASLKPGTVAVAVDNDFTSARQAAEWCSAEGLSGDYECVGVLLDNVPYSQNERSDSRRRYPEEL